MIFELAEDFHDALAAIPKDHPRHRILALLEEAIRRDIHFIEQHPTTLFQCMWNTCWWYDCPEAAKHYTRPEWKWLNADAPPWACADEPKLSTLLEMWRTTKESMLKEFPWIRSLRPPAVHLGAAQEQVLTGHEKPVAHASFTRDGRRIVSWESTTSFSDHAIALRLWNAQTGEQIAVLSQISDGQVRLSPDGLTVVAALEDQTIRSWDMRSGAETVVYRGHVDHPCRRSKATEFGGPVVPEFTLSPDACRVASWRSADGFHVWDKRTGDTIYKCSRDFLGRESVIDGLVYSPDGQYLISWHSDKAIRIWDSNRPTERVVLREHERFIDGVALSHDNSRLASWDIDRQEVFVWDTHHGKRAFVIREQGTVRGLRGRQLSCEKVEFSPDSRRVAISVSREDVVLCDARDGEGITVLGGHDVSGVLGFAFSPDGQRIVTVGFRSDMRIWNTENGSLIAAPRGHGRGDVARASFNADVRQIVSWATDGTIRVWDTDSGTLLRVFDGHADRINSVLFSPDGSKLISASDDKTVRVWSLENKARSDILKGRCLISTAVSSSADGRVFACITDPGQLSIWDGRTGEQIAICRGQETRLGGFSFSPDGKQIACRTMNDTIHVHNTSTGDESVGLLCPPVDPTEYDVERHLDIDFLTSRLSENGICNVLFSSDGRLIVGRHGLTTICVWDSATGVLRRVLRGHEDRITGISISPDGTRIASAAWDKTIRVWSVEEGVEPRVMHIDDHLVVSLKNISFMPDGKRIIVSCSALSDAFQIWNTETGTKLMSLTGHALCAESRDIACTTDGTRIVTSASDRTIRVWNAADGTCQQCVAGIGDVEDISRTLDSTGTLHALTQGPGTVIVRFGVTGPLLYYPSPLAQPKSMKDGRTWAGVAGNCVHVIALEGASLLEQLPILPIAMLTQADEAPQDTTFESPANSVPVRGELANCELTADERVCGNNDEDGVIDRLPDGNKQTVNRRSSDAKHAEPTDPEFQRLLNTMSASEALKAIFLRNTPAPERPPNITRAPASRPHPDSDADRAAQLNIEYQERLKEWKSLWFWQRIFSKKPERPKGI